MSIVSEILPELNGSLESSRRNLVKAGFDVAYGDSYGIKDLKRSIQDGSPAAITLNGKTVLLVGLNESGNLIPYASGINPENAPEISDGKMHRAYNGRAIIVTGKSKTKPEDRGSAKAIIWTPQIDDWPDEWRLVKEKACRTLEDLSSVGSEWLPPHPAIITFRKPKSGKRMGDGSKESDNRGYTDGITVTVMDNNDPITVALHEIGHIYAQTRFTDEDRDALKKIKSEQPENHPLMVTSGWHQDDSGLEMFCDLYMWVIKGLLLEPGYLDIARARLPSGYDFLYNIAKRIRDEASREEFAKSEDAEFMAAADALAKALDRDDDEIAITGTVGKTNVLIGKKKIQMPTISIPEFRFSKIRDLKKGRSIVRINGPISLSGRNIVIDAERNPDWYYMRNNRGYKNARISRKRKLEKSYEQLSMFSENDFAPATEQYFDTSESKSLLQKLFPKWKKLNPELRQPPSGPFQSVPAGRDLPDPLPLATAHP